MLGRKNNFNLVQKWLFLEQHEAVKLHNMLSLIVFAKKNIKINFTASSFDTKNIFR
jgi:hypothetical protein